MVGLKTVIFPGRMRNYDVMLSVLAQIIFFSSTRLRFAGHYSFDGFRRWQECVHLVLNQEKKGNDVIGDSQGKLHLGRGALLVLSPIFAPN